MALAAQFPDKLGVIINGTNPMLLFLTVFDCAGKPYVSEADDLCFNHLSGPWRSEEKCRGLDSTRVSFCVTIMEEAEPPECCAWRMSAWWMVDLKEHNWLNQCGEGQ